MKFWILVALLLGAGLPPYVTSDAHAVDKKPAAKVRALTALDYAEIQQLVARYAFAVDKCTNSGYDYADLYTPDGVFGVADENGPISRLRFEGRERLAQAAGGGKGGCRDPKTLPGYGASHIVVNHVITATPEGASGQCYLLAIGVGGDPHRIERQGGYEDVYVRTPQGWRFKSRVHVWPGMPESLRSR
jgi:hypothetical protein